MRRFLMGLVVIFALVGCTHAAYVEEHEIEEAADRPAFWIAPQISALPPLDSWPGDGYWFSARELPVYPMNELIFNELENSGRWYVRPAPFENQRMRSLSQDDLNAVFPTLELDGVRSWVTFSERALRQIDIFCENDQSFAIIVGVGDIRDTIAPVSFDVYFESELSYVHGVPVRVITYPFGRDFGAMTRFQFHADFAMGSVKYRVRFTDLKDRGKERMTELVNKIIWGGTEGLHLTFYIRSD